MSHRKRLTSPEPLSHSHPTSKRRRSASPRPSFPSHRDIPDLPPKIRLLCEILSAPSPHSSAASIPSQLDETGVRVTASDVESVLRLSYSSPGPALAFFRWAGERHLNHAHSPYAWNLVVDSLGKNLFFDSMWDSVRSMRDLRLLSLATFASVFSSLASAGRSAEALSAFMSLPMYGVPRDTMALNSLLSALCRAGRTMDARASLLEAAVVDARPDTDSFAILLEGCEREQDPQVAREVFDDMIAAVGWVPANVPAYDSFLTTLIISSTHGLSDSLRFLDLLRRNGCSPGPKFFRCALQAYIEKRDARGATALWEEFIEGGLCPPDTSTYNSLISLHCQLSNTDTALHCLDQMVPHGAFPDTETYNTLLHSLLKNRKVKESITIFNEMVKNECFPSERNCQLALKVFLDEGEMEMGVRVWQCMEHWEYELEEGGNLVVRMLWDADLLPEACKHVEIMIDKGIKVSSSTLSKLKQSLQRIGKENVHEHLLRKWKSRK